MNFVDGAFVEAGGRSLPVVSPLDGRQISELALSTASDVDRAVRAAERAFASWSREIVRSRADVFYRYRDLLHRHAAELAELIHVDNGKTVDEARAEIGRAIEVTEFACSLPQLVTGEVLEVSPGVECRVDRVPLGVVASVTPFNFPAMVPHWTIPIAICLGNTFIHKPSEQAPLTAGRIAELLAEAGLPAGVFNVVHGDREAVEALCDHPDVRALSFVGSTPAAKAVYVRATANFKRVLALGGARNHLVVLPDAVPQATAENVVASVAGCAGQRCMAASSLLAVGDVDGIIDRICDEARRLVPGENVGPVISAAARQRIEQAITDAERAGARVLIDGRGTMVPGREGGFYIGPTVVDGVTPDMALAREEIFGPVLAILRAADIDAAISIENASPFGNAAAVYTVSGGAARSIAERFRAGMIGVTVGVPVPLEPFGFGGWNDSRFGAGDITGRNAIDFWTQSRKTTSRWHGGHASSSCRSADEGREH